MANFFRYPGGKSKLKSEIVRHILEHGRGMEYREPFFGGGSVGLEYLKFAPHTRVWINDLDKGLSFLWTSVIQFPDQLKSAVSAFKPSLTQFSTFCEELSDPGMRPTSVDDIVSIGFKKLAIHQMSFSGLGLMGGPLGGWDQSSAYTIDCRWSPKRINKKIDECYGLFHKFDVFKRGCTNYDFSDLFVGGDCPAFLYLDPPYYEKGRQLYAHSFTPDDHSRLATLLQSTNHKWILSYDDHPIIRELYGWAHITEVNVTYSISGANSKRELLISGDGLGEKINYDLSFGKLVEMLHSDYMY